MTNPKFIETGGKRHLWRDVMKLRRELKQATVTAGNPALFDLADDRRPATDRTAAGRYLEPSLFSIPGREG